MGHENFTCTGYFPGVVGKITELHAVYYHEHWGFDVTFETQVARELSDFIARFDPKGDGFWTIVLGDELAGAVAIDSIRAESEGARLRWFIVGPRYQGRGIGRALLRQALDFCRSKAHRKVYLWTFKGLDTARQLYEAHGGRLTEEHQVSQWGSDILEQKFEIYL